MRAASRRTKVKLLSKLVEPKTMILTILLIFLSCTPVVLCAANGIHLFMVYRKTRVRPQLWYVCFTGINGYVTIIFILLYAALFAADYILKNANHLLLYLPLVLLMQLLVVVLK